jgi:hypothetical protein
MGKVRAVLMKTGNLIRRSCQMSLVGVAACAAFLTAGAEATVTVGSPLTASFTGNFGGTDTELDTAFAEPGAHATSPVNGTIVTYRVLVGPLLGPYALRVMRPGAGGAYTGAGTSAVANPTATGTTATFSTSLPIHAGDFIGLDLVNTSSRVGQASVPGSTVAEWNPPLVPDGPTSSPDTLYPNAELGYNADVIPSNSVDLGQTNRNKKKGTATLNLTVPNPGTVTASGRGVRASTRQVAAGPVGLLLKASGKKRKALNAKGKAKLNAVVTYTPTFGEAHTESVKVKLKKKL